MRGAEFFWKSSDCGQTWTALPAIDFATFTVDGEKGRLGWPNKVKNDPWFGGCDRPELYANPFYDEIYFSAGCTAGSLPKYASHKFDKGILLVSEDNAQTWSDAGLYYDGWKPLAMTSTPRMVFVADCVGKDTVSGAVILHWFYLDGSKPVNPDGTNPPNQATIYFGEPVNADFNTTKLDNHCFDLQDNQIWPHVSRIGSLNVSLSRVTEKASLEGFFIRVGYPACEGCTIEKQSDGTQKLIPGRQVFHVVTVQITEHWDVITYPITTISADDSQGSIVHATFIETDRVDLKDDLSDAVLYWLETKPSEGLIARYSLFRGTGDWSPRKDLSVDNSGKRRYIGWGESLWLGHYLKGAFYCEEDRLNYLAQWPEYDSTLKLTIHYNIVSVKEKLKTNCPSYSLYSLLGVKLPGVKPTDQNIPFFPNAPFSNSKVDPKGREGHEYNPVRTPTVPQVVVPKPNTATPTITHTPLPIGGVGFFADATSVVQGQCTTIHWRTQNIAQVFLDNNAVNTNGDEQVCPRQNTTHTLRVITLDRQTVERTITINVVAAPTATLTRAPLPTFTPTASPTLFRTTFTGPTTSTNQFYYRGNNCGPKEVTINEGVTDPQGVRSVNIVFRLQDKATNATTNFVSYAMTNVSGNTWSRTFHSETDIRDFSLYSDAWFQFYFLATDNSGAQSNTQTFSNSVSLSVCSR